MSKNRTIKILSIFQIIICLVLVINIYVKKNIATISPINKNSIQQIESQNLKYYYEYNPNEKVVDSSQYTKSPITFIYNNDGFNDLYNYSIEKNPQNFRILILGDSFTYGDHVATKDNWTEILETKLNQNKICQNIDKFEVINTAVMGYDPQYEVELYKRKGQKYNPDLIIWMLIDSIRLNEVNLTVEKDCYKKYTDSDNPNIDIVKKCRTISTDVLSEEEVTNKQRENISQIYNYYKGKIFFVDYFYETHKNIIELKDNTYYPNLLPDFLKNTKYNHDSTHFSDSHPNQIAHNLIANQLYKKLFELNQIPCQPLVQK